jgi:hypothetical protein
VHFGDFGDFGSCNQLQEKCFDEAGCGNRFVEHKVALRHRKNNFDEARDGKVNKR